MDSWVVAMMLGASLVLGGIALIAFLWGIKSGQFDDKEKFLNSALYDDESELNDAVEQERKKKKLQEKNYRPE
ncbi:MAG: cbb3-type cytochrome oxidase assembly protein CcoS [Campylobacterota bacterium]|nr:cbb3-type cytochrome oxidase assembly protein CcoS [Campylobacterota bacterium]